MMVPQPLSRKKTSATPMNSYDPPAAWTPPWPKAQRPPVLLAELPEARLFRGRLFVLLRKDLLRPGQLQALVVETLGVELI